MNKTDSNSIRFQVIAAQEAAIDLPVPPSPLDDDAMSYWSAIMCSKRVTAWTASDLHVAVQLCRDLATAELLQSEIDEYGPVLVNDKSGRRYANPAAGLLDQCKRRILAATRSLQIHSVATNGKTDHQGSKNEASRRAALTIKNLSPLFARPTED